MSLLNQTLPNDVNRCSAKWQGNRCKRRKTCKRYVVMVGNDLLNKINAPVMFGKNNCGDYIPLDKK